MGKINVLSFAVANLIAAGEVVDRPASVIKELMENSIDAGANQITVEIQKGGTLFMRVSDNGCGIDPEDLPTALRRHATSKIKDAEDLDAIMSLGFRGEALAAISSVSDIRIISKTRENAIGAMIESHGGNVLGVTERGTSDGTTVIVENLFSNVPARRKFLKKDVTEAMAVLSTVEKVALSHPEISFKFISDGVSRLETSGDGNSKNAIYSVFGREFASKMLEVSADNEGIKVNGYIGRSDNVRANRNFQNFFINGRYVKSKTAMAAIEQAYSSYIPPEKFPCCVLFINIDPRTVDVNVHPAKLEVKFSNERPVFESIYYAVRNTLEKNVTRPEVRLENGHITSAEYRNLSSGRTGSGCANTSPEKKINPVSAFAPIRDPSAPKPKQLTYDSVKIEPKTVVNHENRYVEPVVSIPSVKNASSFQTSYFASTAGNKEKSADKKQTIPPQHISTPIISEPPEPMNEHKDTETKERAKREIPPYRIVGEAFNSYVFIDLGDKMLIVDKHAAHERIIFEHFKEIMKSREQASQMLLLPIEVSLRADECHALSDYRESIEAAGFVFQIINDKVNVYSSPTGISTDAVPEIFETFADQLLKCTGNVALTRDLIFEKALYQASCKAAIKAGRQYADGHIEWICRKLMEIPDITFCPHGRPVAIEMTKTELDKQFERL